ncbi:unnamed protein product [Polarella glacialis]|uniref:Uncharacterized protein n=1 Tax=Polarella glacialis TaxID=89957 RepID=A0A813LJB6_POLGL|nr:unnamed protein product [Polarella glacialis]
MVVGHFLIKIGCLNMFKQLLCPTLKMGLYDWVLEHTVPSASFSDSESHLASNAAVTTPYLCLYVFLTLLLGVLLVVVVVVVVVVVGSVGEHRGDHRARA